MTAYNIVSPTSLQAGQPEDVSVILANLQAIASVLNGGIDNANINPAAAIAISKLAGYPSDGAKILRGDGIWAALSGIPAGVMVPFGGATAPSGWLMCNGSLVSRTTYADLFTAIGTIHGAGDGSTTFALPDAQGRGIVGLGTHADVNAVGKNDGLGVAARTYKHQHDERAPLHSHTTNADRVTGSWTPGGGGGGAAPSSWTTGAVAAVVGGVHVGPAGTPTDGPASLVLPYIIKT